MKDKILKLRKLGKSYNEIADKLGCSKSTISYHCSVNGKESNRIKSYETRKKLRDDIKLFYGGKCSICGYNRCLSSLCFHHKDPSIKEEKVAILINARGKFAAYEEAKKCVLVCANCHGEIHEGLTNLPIH